MRRPRRPRLLPTPQTAAFRPDSLWWHLCILEALTRHSCSLICCQANEETSQKLLEEYYSGHTEVGGKTRGFQLEFEGKGGDVWLACTMSSSFILIPSLSPPPVIYPSLSRCHLCSGVVDSQVTNDPQHTPSHGNLAVSKLARETHQSTTTTATTTTTVPLPLQLPLPLPDYHYQCYNDCDCP